MASLLHIHKVTTVQDRQLTQSKRSKRPPPFVELEKEKVELATAIGYISDDNATIKLDGAAETRT